MLSPTASWVVNSTIPLHSTAHAAGSPTLAPAPAPEAPPVKQEKNRISLAFLRRTSLFDSATGGQQHGGSAQPRADSRQTQHGRGRDGGGRNANENANERMTFLRGVSNEDFTRRSLSRERDRDGEAGRRPDTSLSLRSSSGMDCGRERIGSGVKRRLSAFNVGRKESKGSVRSRGVGALAEERGC